MDVENEEKILYVKFKARVNKFYYSRLSCRYHMIQTVNLFFSILFSTTAFTAFTNIIPVEMQKIVAMSSVASLSILNVFIAVFSIGEKAKKSESSKVEWMIVERRILDLNPNDTNLIDNIEKEIERMQIDEDQLSIRLLTYAYERACIELGIENRKYRQS